MNTILVRALIAILAATSLSMLGAQTFDFPTRKAGLWEINMQGEGMPTQKAKHCVDEKTDKQMQQMSQAGPGTCTPAKPQKDGNSIVFETECSFGKQKVASRTVITGDFQSNVRTEVTSKFIPAMAGKTQDKMVMDAKWAGACPAGWKPGDMEMGPGMRMNVNQMMQGATGAAKK